VGGREKKSKRAWKEEAHVIRSHLYDPSRNLPQCGPTLPEWIEYDDGRTHERPDDPNHRPRGEPSNAIHGPCEKEGERNEDNEYQELT
jgi:hypothetical protein